MRISAQKYFLLILYLNIGTFAFAQHFQAVWQTPFNPMNIYITQATINDIDLEAGDEIGVFDVSPTLDDFCVGSITLSEPIPSGEFVQFICSMNDGINPNEPNGFNPGNDFIFRFWDESSQTEIEDVVFSFPYSGYDEVFNPLGTAIVALAGSQQITETQILELRQGWTGISSYLVPEDPQLAVLLSAIESNFVILVDFDGNYYQSNSDIGLTEWQTSAGYFIKMENQEELTLQGFLSSNQSITIEPGWNLIPVLSEVSVSIVEILSENITKTEIIKDAVGTGVFWPALDVASLNELLPGKSYLIKADEEFEIIF